MVERVKRESNGYDCVIPVSGGKDSTWQVVKCLEQGLRPLAVTWRPPGRTEIGQRNLDNLVRIGVDHIDFSINPDVERRFMLEALEKRGSTGIPMHLAIFNIPVKIAHDMNIRLIVWGENSAIEYGVAPADDTSGEKMDAEWLRKYGVSQGTSAQDWIGGRLSKKDLTPYFGPSPEQLAAKGISAIFLGYYLPWDPVETFRVAKEHGFSSDAAGPRTGLYEFADIDDHFISIHHYLKWHKFGFTRIFDNLSLEIRNRRISRDQAIETIRRVGDQRPNADIERFCAFTGISVKRFDEICEKFRNYEIWKKSYGKWMIPGFLIPDWKWNESAP